MLQSNQPLWMFMLFFCSGSRVNSERWQVIMNLFLWTSVKPFELVTVVSGCHRFNTRARSSVKRRDIDTQNFDCSVRSSSVHILGSIEAVSNCSSHENFKMEELVLTTQGFSSCMSYVLSVFDWLCTWWLRRHVKWYVTGRHSILPRQ